MNQYYKFVLKKMLFVYIIFLTIFTVIVYSVYLFNVSKNYKQTEQNILEQFAITLEKSLNSSTNLSMSLCNNIEITDYALSTSSPTPSEIYSAQLKLASEAGYIQELWNTYAITSSDLNHLITPQGSTPMSFFESNYGFELNELRDKLSDFIASDNNKICLTSTKASRNRSDYIFLCLQHRIPNSGVMLFITVYELQSLFSSLQQHIIPGITDIQIKDTLISYNSIENTAAFSDSIVQHSGYVQSADKSVRSHAWGNIEFSFYSPTIQYIFYINNFIVLFLLLILLLFFVGAILIKNTTNNIYMPIDKLVRKLPKNLEISNTADTSEITLFEQYVEQLVRQKDLMHDIISENRIQLEDKFFMQLLNGMLSDEDIQEGIKTYHLRENSLPLTVFIIKYQNFDSIKNTVTLEGISEIRFSLQSYLRNLFSEYSFFKIIDIEQQEFAIIISEGDIDRLSRILKSNFLNIESTLLINIFAVIGSRADDWKDLYVSYKNATYASRKHIFPFQNNIVISYKDLQNTDSIVNFSHEDEKELIDSVCSCNLQKSTDIISNIIDTNAGTSIVTAELHSQFVVLLYSAISKIVSTLNKTEKKLFGDTRIYLELIQCTNKHQLKSKMVEFISIIIEDIEKTQKTLEEANTQTIISYTNEHYADNISLITLAEHLNVSQSYASRIFKNLIGENFKDYLANIRLNKAVELMKNNPSLKLNEIATAVGYRTETFTRAFSKKYGMLPSNYINLINNDSGEENND